VAVPETISRRPATRADAAAVAALVAADETALLGRPSRVVAGDMLAWWSRCDLETNSWLLEENGRLVGAGWFEYRAHAPVAFFVGIVAAGQKGRGLGGMLSDLGESHAASSGAERVHTWTLAADAAAAVLFESRGFREVRRFYDMAIELDGPVPEPLLPDGLTLETFREEDARPFHDALSEAFKDHWEHHPRPFEQWWAERQKVHDYTPELWYLVRDGEEIAATVINDPERSGGGYVGALGVRRPWRGLGLGKALLYHSFAEFQRRGQTRVTLGVDADSPTGATKLYERVGMHVELESVVFEKAVA